LVSVEPSANFTVGTTWLPPLTEPTNSAASGSASMSTSVQAIPSVYSAYLSRAQKPHHEVVYMVSAALISGST
jgi:hypothetical protein